MLIGQNYNEFGFGFYFLVVFYYIKYYYIIIKYNRIAYDMRIISVVNTTLFLNSIF